MGCTEGGLQVYDRPMAFVSAATFRRWSWAVALVAVVAAHAWVIRASWGPAAPEPDPASTRFVDVLVLNPPPAPTPSAPPAGTAPPRSSAAAAGTPGRDRSGSDRAPASPVAAAPSVPETASLPEPASTPAPPGAQDVQAHGSPAPEPAIPPPAAVAAPGLPASGTWVYDVAARTRGLTFNARAQLTLAQSDGRYQAQFEVRAMLAGSRTQRSEGSVTPAGLVPHTFTDRARRERVLQFDWEAQRVTEGGAGHPLLPGTQDRLSVMLQLGQALHAHAPAVGGTLELPVASAGGVEVWRFAVLGLQRLDLPQGSEEAWHLKRQVSATDQGIELWYAVADPRVPVRIRLLQGNGDEVDQALRSHTPGPAPPGS